MLSEKKKEREISVGGLNYQIVTVNHLLGVCKFGPLQSQNEQTFLVSIQIHTHIFI